MRPDLHRQGTRLRPRHAARAARPAASSGTNRSHGNVHKVTASPRRSAGPRPRPGSMNAMSARGQREEAEQLLPADLRESPQRLQLLVREHPSRQPATSRQSGQITRLEGSLSGHIRPIFGGCCGDPIRARSSSPGCCSRSGLLSSCRRSAVTWAPRCRTASWVSRTLLWICSARSAGSVRTCGGSTACIPSSGRCCPGADSLPELLAGRLRSSAPLGW